MTALFRANVPDAQLRIIELRGDRVGREKVLAEIRGLGEKGLAAGRDILVVYYHGHGGYDLQAADHVMCSSDGWIHFYHDIAPAADQVHPRATLIFSDACAVLLVGQSPRRSSPAGAARTSVPPWSCLRSRPCSSRCSSISRRASRRSAPP
jgi:hypothetical protein